MSETTALVLRLLAGTSQTELSRRSGIHQSRLSRWSRGFAPTAADDALRLKALADAQQKAKAAG